MRTKGLGDEKYSIIIASTDARKKSTSFSLTRRALILILSAIIIIIFVCVGAAVVSILQVSSYSEQIEALKKQVSEHTEMVATDEPLGALPKPSPEISAAAQSTPEETQSVPSSAQQLQENLGGDQIIKEQTSSIQVTAVPSVTPEPSLSEDTAAKVTTKQSYLTTAASAQNIEGMVPADSIQMKDAINSINADFQSAIDNKINAIKEKETYDTVKVVYDGDMDGDSNTVNNWADVLSVFMVETMNDGQKLLTITPDNIKLLTDIYYEMNVLSIDCEKVANADENSGNEKATTLIVHVNVNSLTYSEAASINNFSKKQKSNLDELMSPAYYTYFEGLLGIDVYDGVPSQQIEDIVASLPQGSKGSEIVKAALIRVGSPYSKSKRGSGNYVDCSYFAWWAYNQAGISIPRSSVEQALYCYNNKCTMKLSELAPGDLIFWSKTDCDCGRWREIHHVGIYIGNDMIIDASSCKGRVVIRKIWHGTEWKIAFCARPYDMGGDIVTKS